MKDPTPAAMFVDINSKQTKVPSSLLWELYPDIYGPDEPENYKAVISRVTEDVAKRQLVGFVQHISSGMKGEISFHTLCAEVNRTHLLGLLPGEEQLRVILDAFFIALKQLEEQYPGVNSNFVFSNRGITPMIRTLGRIVQYEIGHNRRDNLKRKQLLIQTFRDFFEPVYKYYVGLGETKLRALRKQRIGNAGSNLTEDEITDKIRAGYKADFPYRPKRIPPDWENAVSKLISLIRSINSEAIERGKMNTWVFREFDGEKFKKRLAKPIDDYDSFGTVLKVLYQELIEGSGKDAPDNRLARLLQAPRIYELAPIARLNILRTCWEHKPEQVDARKRQLAVQALAELAHRDDLAGLSDLDPTDYQNIALALIGALTEGVLEPALAALHKS